MIARAMTARLTLRTAAHAALLSALLLAVAPLAHAHEFGASRQVLVSVTPDTVEMLVLWELGASAESRMFDGLLDANGDGQVDGALERFAAARTLMPHALQGLGLTIDGEPPRLELVRAVFEPADRVDTTAGWQGGVLLRTSWTPGVACRELRVVREPDSPEVSRVVLEGLDVRVVESSATQLDGGDDWVARLPAGGDASWCIARDTGG